MFFLHTDLIHPELNTRTSPAAPNPGVQNCPGSGILLKRAGARSLNSQAPGTCALISSHFSTQHQSVSSMGSRFNKRIPS